MNLYFKTLVSSLIAITCFLPFRTCFGQTTTPQFTLKKIISPNYCLGESYYKIIFQTSGGIVSADRGIVVGDTIKNISEKNYQLLITVTGADGTALLQTIQLPIVDLILPEPAIAPSYTVCENEALPKLTALSLSSRATVDWYDQLVGGTKVATGSLTYQPTQAGTYYALTRDTSNGCVAFSRTPATITVQKLPCAFITVKKVNLR